MDLVGSLEHLPLFGGLVAVSAVGAAVQCRGHQGPPGSLAFKEFQRSYLAVYLLLVTADWLQGSYLYALYREYGFSKAEIGELFVFGFGSSGVMGMVVGPAADLWGRRRMVFVFVFMYVASCITKHCRQYAVLALGRVLGGIGTSILFTTLDAWMVHEHKARAFEPAWLADSFAKAACGNGVVAILSGVVAAVVVRFVGTVVPFDVSIGFSLLGGLVVALRWNENYGAPLAAPSVPQQGSSLGGSCGIFGGMAGALQLAMASFRDNPRILFCGLVQSFFEGAMYAFVFLWTPMLPVDVNFGVIFGCFMVAVMLGSQVSQLARRFDINTREVLAVNFAVSFVAFIIPVVAPSSRADLILFAFLLYEGSVGVYFSTFYALRAEVVPDKGRATILNIFRLPLNGIVVGLCLYAGTAQPRVVFSICALFQVCCALCTVAIGPVSRPHHQPLPTEEGDTGIEMEGKAAA